MKVVTVVKTGRGGSGISQMTRYISERERDEQREGSEPRKLFSGDEERLNFYQANCLLGGGREPKAKDVLHVVISFEKEDDFNLLGPDEETRQGAVRETTRSTMKEVIELFKADDLRWVAGIHHNTDNPHVHLLIHRDYTDRETEQSRRLKTLPRDLRVSWERTEDRKQVVKPGKLNETFERFLEQRIERMKQDIREERFLLGRTMIAEYGIERLKKRLDDTIKYGKYYRYQFTDGGGRSRGFSEHDVRQRGWAKVIQVMANDQSNLTPEMRRQMREEIIADEFGRHQEVIIKHRKNRGKQIEGITAELEKKEGESRHLIERAAQIKSRYEAAGKAPPVPILCRDELSGLQDHAVEMGDTTRVRKLEDIRTTLAAESGTPTRRDIEIGRLRSQLFVVQSSLTLEQETARRFEDTKHLMCGDSMGGYGDKARRGGTVTRSLAEIERMLVWEKDQAKFIGSRYIHWDDSRRREAGIRVENLTRERERMLNQIEARRAEISDQVERKAELVTTLYGILSKEEQRYRNEGQELSRPLFSAHELKELDNHALRRRDPEFHRTLLEIERNLEHNLDPRTDPKEWPTFYKRVGRARARAYLTEIGLRQSELSLERFNERREHTDVIIKDDGKRSITIARLADVEPTSPLEQLLRPLTTPGDRYSEVTAALEAYNERIVEEHKKAAASFDLLVEEARRYEGEFPHRSPGDPTPKPRFTLVEVSKLELHAAKEADPTLKAKYEELYCEALEVDESDREAQKIILEDKAEEILNPVSLDHPELISEMQYEYDYLQRPGPTHEVSIER